MINNQVKQLKDFSPIQSCNPEFMCNVNKPFPSFLSFVLRPVSFHTPIHPPTHPPLKSEFFRAWKCSFNPPPQVDMRIHAHLLSAWVVFLSFQIGIVLGSGSDVYGSSSRSVVCEPIKVDMCGSLGYNLTGMPNFAHSSRQADAQYTLETFIPLILKKCSPEIEFFLCAVYIPVCLSDVELQPLIGPCRSLCQRVRDQCESEMVKYDVDWPEVLECDRFPETNSHEHMCMERPEGDRRDMPALSVSSSTINNLKNNPVFMEKVDSERHQLQNLAGQLPQSHVMLNELLNGRTGAQDDLVCRANNSKAFCGGANQRSFTFIGTNFVESVPTLAFTCPLGVC